MSRYFVAGHNGLVGRAIVRALKARRRTEPAIEIVTRDHSALDLTEQAAVRAFFDEVRPDVVILSAARAGGIQASTASPAEFIYRNMMIAANVIDAAHNAGVQRLLQCGASCIYPRASAYPLAEAALLTGKPDPGREPYSIAKISAIKLCESYNRQYGRDYRSIVPCNLYGPGDTFDPETGHLVPALMRRFHDAVQSGANEVAVWGTGAQRREVLHVDDMAVAAMFVHDLPLHIHRANTRPMVSHINVGSGQDPSVRELAGMIARVTGFRGHIRTDPARPEGFGNRLMDSSLLTAMGWRPRIALEDGLSATYRWFVENRANLST